MANCPINFYRCFFFTTDVHCMCTIYLSMLMLIRSREISALDETQSKIINSIRHTRQRVN